MPRPGFIMGSEVEISRNTNFEKNQTSRIYELGQLMLSKQYFPGGK
jgi:hypothetical protein